MGSQFFQIPGLSTLSQSPSAQPSGPAPSATGSQAAAAAVQGEEPKPDGTASTTPTTGTEASAVPEAETTATNPVDTSVDATTAMEMDVDHAHDVAKAYDAVPAPAVSPPSPPSLLQGLEAQLGSYNAPPTEANATAEQQAPAGEQNTEMQDADQSMAAQGDPAQEGEGVAGQAEWEEDSSPYESSSDSSSSDDSDDDDDDSDDGKALMNPEALARILMEADSDEEGEGKSKGAGAGGQLRTKNEITEEVIPKPDVTITPETKIEELGEIEFIVENTIVIKASATGEYQALETGAVLCNQDRTVVAAMADLIGSVREPRYTARFTNEEEIQSFGLGVGSKVFYVPEHSSYVETGPLRAMKGTDASNWHDEEAGEDEMEFSDDEKEQAYKREQKEKKRARRGDAPAGNAGGRGGRGGRGRGGHHDGSSHGAADPGALNYDDDDDGPYRPLARPAGFGTGAPPPVFTHGAPNGPSGNNRGGRGRGRGRGNDRGGRGNRGNRGGHGHSLPPRPQGQNSQPQQQPQAPYNGYAAPPPPQFGQGGYPAPPPQFFGGNNGQQATAPAMPFPFPAWPQSGGANFVPPPPPQFQQQPTQQQPPAPNPQALGILYAALQSQWQQSQQNGGAGQQQPHAWPPQGGSG